MREVPLVTITQASTLNEIREELEIDENVVYNFVAAAISNAFENEI